MRRGVVGMMLLASLVACTRNEAGSRPTTKRPVVQVEKASFTEDGRARADRHGARDDATPRYAVEASVEPSSGRVRVREELKLPRQEADEVRLRVFANLPEFDSGFTLDETKVDGRAVKPELDRSILTLPVRSDGAVTITLRFSYTVRAVEAGNALSALGEGLNPAKVGLLGRHDNGLSLGHWLALYLPPGSSHDPVPDGFGDIGNFPAATFDVTVSVPRGWKVVTGGVNIGTQRKGERVVYHEAGAGMRDLSVYAGRNLEQRTVEVGGTTIRATAHAARAKHLDTVLRDTKRALEGLSASFGPYVWRELDVVDVPLGASVGGMEWPGAVWIASDIFAGQLPGLGGLGGLGDLFGGGGKTEEGKDGKEGTSKDNPLGDLFGDKGLEGLLGGIGGEQVTTMREFTIAHEVAHQWWHAMVGNDSITSPAFDEPLAQFSACAYWTWAHGEAAGTRVCDLHVTSQYKAMRQLGNDDAPADQPSDAFDSSLQYGGVVYGKAPNFYRRLSDVIGRDAVLAALRTFVQRHLLGEAKPDDLLATFTDAAPDKAAEIEALWQRWIHQAHGDEDLGVTAGGGVTGDIPGLDPDALQKLLDQILNPDKQAA